MSLEAREKKRHSFNEPKKKTNINRNKHRGCAIHIYVYRIWHKYALRKANKVIEKT